MRDDPRHHDALQHAAQQPRLRRSRRRGPRRNDVRRPDGTWRTQAPIRAQARLQAEARRLPPVGLARAAGGLAAWRIAGMRIEPTLAAWRGIAALRVEPPLAEWRASAALACRKPVERWIARAVTAGWSRNRPGMRRHRASARQGSPPTCGEPRCLDSFCAPPCPDLASPRPPLRIPSRLENPRVRGRFRPLARPDYCLPHID